MGSHGDDDGRTDSCLSRNILIMKALFSILIFLIAFLSDAYSQTEWEFRKEEEGIKAYTRTREGIKFNEYKVTMTLDATINEMLSLFKDFDTYASIFPGTEDHKVYLDEPTRHITYARLDIPFPARDRDIVFDNVLSYDATRKILSIDIQCIPDKYETNGRLIRITNCDGGWEIQDIGNGQVSVKHNMIVDPAGFAPAFIVNAKTIDDPIKTLKSMREHLSTHPYPVGNFSLLKED